MAVVVTMTKTHDAHARLHTLLTTSVPAVALVAAFAYGADSRD